MAVFVALYRGINVGGKHSVKMELLRAMHERLGHQQVKSYIQSGNVVFSAKGTVSAITTKTAAEFAEEFGFTAKIIVLDAKRWNALVDSNPYAKFAVNNHKSVHAGICEREPSAAGLKTLLTKTGGSEMFTIQNEIVYLYAPDGFGTSKFAAGMEKAGGVSMTMRNWRTIEAVSEIVRAIV